MKKRSARSREPEMLAEYDFSNAVRGKYASRFGGGRNIVALEPDVFKMFKDEKSVNDALRVLCGIIKQHRKK